MYLFAVASLLTSVRSVYLYYRNLKINNRIAFLEKELDRRGVEYERDEGMDNAHYVAFLAFLIRIDNFTNILEIYLMAAGIDSNKRQKIMNNKHDLMQGLYHLSFVNAEDYITVLNNTYFTVVKETISTLRMRTKKQTVEPIKRFEMLVRRNAVDLTGTGADVHLPDVVPDVVPDVDQQNDAVEETKATEPNTEQQNKTDDAIMRRILANMTGTDLKEELDDENERNLDERTNTVVSQSIKLSHKVHTNNKEFMDLPELEYDNNVADGQNKTDEENKENNDVNNNTELVADEQNENDEQCDDDANNNECCTCCQCGEDTEENDQDNERDDSQADGNQVDENESENVTEDQAAATSNADDNDNGTGHNCEYCSKTNDDNRFSDLAGGRPYQNQDPLDEDQDETDDQDEDQPEDENVDDQNEDQKSNSSSNSDAESESGKGESVYVNAYDMHVSKASEHLISVMRTVVNAYVFDDDIGFPCGCEHMNGSPWADISNETNTHPATHNNSFANPINNLSDNTANNASTTDNGMPVFWRY